MFELENQRMHYAWGDHASIPTLLGETAADQPVAEYWLGAHPNASSRLASHPSRPTLDQWIREYPREALGEVVADTYGARLPFLMKVLAVAEPLSLQVHPSSAVARAGYRRESRSGPESTAPTRNYKDPYHKPEMIYALSPFTGLAGFRAVPEIVDIMRASGDLWLRGLAGELLEVLHPAGNAQMIRSIVRHMLSLSLAEVRAHTARLVVNVQRRRESSAWDDLESRAEIEFTFDVFEELVARYPNDPGSLVALLLNPFRLQPGEAHFVPAGAMHCYLSGTGIEIMATSDNVLRAGLTQKHVDVRELLMATEFGSPDVPRPIEPHEVYDGVRQFSTGTDEFELLAVQWGGEIECDLQQLTQATEEQPRIDGGPRILLCLDGQFTASTTRGVRPEARLAAGESLFVPANNGDLTLRGRGHLMIGRVPGA
ncbi:mannose-6-phosphate isomerase, class I [Micrococcales bacterium 31B]|nr:mannose-6-phosphate isomerase, class I [Micrococcales bacterium 31B]